MHHMACKYYLFGGLVSCVASGFLVGGRTDKVHALPVEFGEHRIVFGDRDGETVHVRVVAQQTAVIVTASDRMAFYQIQS